MVRLQKSEDFGVLQEFVDGLPLIRCLNTRDWKLF